MDSQLLRKGKTGFRPRSVCIQGHVHRRYSVFLIMNMQASFVKKKNQSTLELCKIIGKDRL